MRVASARDRVLFSNLKRIWRGEGNLDGAVELYESSKMNPAAIVRIPRSRVAATVDAMIIKYRLSATSHHRELLEQALQASVMNLHVVIIKAVAKNKVLSQSE